MTPKRVLVVDDEELVQEIVQAVLEDVGGWEVLIAGSGRDGLAIAQAESLDAILLDVSMPEMDGIETFRHLQAHPITQAIPVILLTAKVHPVDKTHFSQLRIAGVIIKPFDPMTLTAEVAGALNWNL